MYLKKQKINSKTYNNKKYIYMLKQKYGIGYSLALNICSIFGIPPYINSFYINQKSNQDIETWIKTNLKTGRALNLEQKQNIALLMKNRSRRGLRHSWRLPVRGQRTKTNAKTQKRRKK